MLADGLVVGGGGGGTIADGLDLALGFAFVLDADGAAASGWVGGHCG